MQLDETRLVALVCKGDQRAYSELVERHLPAIEVYAKRIVSDDTLAQDIAQRYLVRCFFSLFFSCGARNCIIYKRRPN